MSGFDAPSVAGSRSRALAVITPSLVCLSLLTVGSPAEAGVTPPAVREANIVLQQGDLIAGSQAATINPPYVNDAGEVAFSGQMADGDNYVFIGAGVAFIGGNEFMATLDALEPRLDSNAAGNWAYPVDIDGADGLYTDGGIFAAAGDPISAAGVPMGSTYTFLGNPAMTDSGELYYVAGVNTGGGFTAYYALFRTPDGTEASSELVVGGTDMIDMFTVDDNQFGIDFDYAVSRDGMHRINILNMEGDTATDSFVRVDGMFVAREGDPTGDGDNWQVFELVTINNAGSYMFTGNTDGGFATNDFLAYNGTIVMREGDMIDGVQIPGGSELRTLALSNNEQAVYMWAYNGPAGFRESVFFACNAADVPGSSILVFTTDDDEIDIDGDDVGDFLITDVTVNQPTLSRAIGDTPFVYAPLALDDGMGMGPTQAMVEFPVTCCGNGSVDPGEDCDDGNDEDTDDCIACVAAFCGDGFLQDGVETCDDGNLDDTDDCPTNCEPATCGDGFVQDGVEECDDGNTDDGDGCESDCTVTPASSTGGVDDSTGGGDDSTGGMADGTTGGNTTATGGNTGPVTVTAGNTMGGMDGSGTDTEGETDSDSDTAGGVGTDDGCNCRSGGSGPAGALWGLMGLGLLGLGRRRRL